MRRFRFCLAAAMILSAAAYAATPEDIAKERAASEKVLAATPEAQATWESLGDGALRHKPSGLVCPSHNVPAIPLTKIVILVSPPPEHNALCLYDTADKTYSTQLAATKVGEGTPVTKTLANMREIVLQQYKDATSLGPQTHILIPSAQGEAFATTENGKPCITVLYVTVVKDWAVWMMATMPSTKQDASTAHLVSMVLSGAFHVGVMGVTRTANGIPEPRGKP